MKIEVGVDYFNKKDLTAYIHTESSDGYPVWFYIALSDETSIYSLEEMQEMMDNKILEDIESYAKRLKRLRSSAKKIVERSSKDLIGKPIEIETYIGEKYSCRLEEYVEALETLHVTDLYFSLGEYDQIEKDAIVPIDAIVSMKPMTRKTHVMWSELFKEDEPKGLNGKPVSENLFNPLYDKKGKKKAEKLKQTTIKLPELYCPELVNATMNPMEISKKLKIALGKENRPQCITILMSGVAGTGKSLAAQYIANELGKPLISIKLGEILGKYVGETEGKIQEAFKQAQEENAIIIIDEFDSISGDRDGSDRNHQVSMVNSLLQALDTFEGIAFMTTNSTNRIDTAVRRRILLDITFNNLSGEQADIFASRFFKRRRISGLDDGVYAPADFSKTSDSLIFVDDKEINKKFLIEKLKEVAAIRNGKQITNKEPMGFRLN